MYAGNPAYVYSLVITLLTAITMPVLIYVNWHDMPWQPKLLGGIATGLSGALATWFLRRLGTTRPFRVFSEGITASRVPFGHGFLGRDLFIPFDRVERILAWKLMKGVRDRVFLIITYREDGGTRETTVYEKDVRLRSDAVLELLRRNVSDRLEVKDDPWRY